MRRGKGTHSRCLVFIFANILSFLLQSQIVVSIRVEANVGCEHSDWLSDGSCDVVNNNQECQWDGGDCCEDTAPSNVVDTDYCPGDCSCRDPNSEFSGVVYATFDDLKDNYHGPDVKVEDPESKAVTSIAKWFVGNLNEQMGAYSSSRLKLQKTLHAMTEHDTVFFNEVVDGQTVQFPVQGRTHSIVVLTEQRVNSKLYQNVEIPLWEVRNATIFNTSFTYEEPFLIHHHVPIRTPVTDSLGVAQAQLVIDSLNAAASVEDRYQLSHYGGAERQCLDIDQTDLFYEKDNSTGRVTICLSYISFAADDRLAHEEGTISPKLFIGAVYRNPNKMSEVVSIMDLQKSADVKDYANLQRIVRPETDYAFYYDYGSNYGSSSWIFVFLVGSIAAMGIATACFCNRTKRFWRRQSANLELPENQSLNLKYESDNLTSGASL